MKPLALLLFVQLCMLAALPVIAANPLIKQEVFPFTNPSFEDNLKDWAGSAAADNYRTGPGLAYDPTSTPKTICESAETVASDGHKSLCFALDKKVDYLYLSRMFQLTKGAKYCLSMKVKTVGATHASLRVVYGASGEPQSRQIEPNTDWQEVGVCFVGTDRRYAITDPDPAVSYCELRLHVFGLGKVYFDDLRVYEMETYAPTLRVQLLEPATEKYRVMMYARVSYPKINSYKTWFADQGVSPGTASPWINLGEDTDFQGSPFDSVPDVVPVGLHFESMTGEAFKKIKARVDFAYGPGEEKILKSFVAETPGNIIGVFLPRSEAPPGLFTKSFRPIKEDVMERNAQVKALQLPPVNLKLYHVEAHIAGFGRCHSDPEIARMEIDTVRGIGFSALSTEYSGMAGMYRELGVKAGFTKTAHTQRAFNLPAVNPTTADPLLKDAVKKWGSVFLLNWDDIKRNISNSVGQFVISLKNEDAAQIPYIKFVDIGDEIGGWIFVGKEYDEQYREYLKSQGITPREMGQQRWEDVKPGSWDWNESIPRRPKDRTDVVACRNYYWSLKYWTWCNARIYSIMTKELDKRLPGIPTRVNFGQPWTNACSDIRGTEIWEFARQKSITALNNEDWLNTYGWRFSGIQLNAYLADLNRSCAMIHHVPVQAMVMPDRERQMQRKLASVVGKGAKFIDLYSYGPFYASSDNWSQDPGEVKGVAQFLRKLEGAEDVCYPGMPRKSDVAIIWSASNELWRETDATIYNGHYIYFGLLHQQIPIDYLDEVEIIKGRLKDYKVAYLSSEYLRRDTQQAVMDWVKEGGCLWTDACCATGDEYGQKSDLLFPVIGIQDVAFTESKKTDYNPQYALPQQQPLDTITFNDTGGKVDVIGKRASFKLTEPAATTVLAQFQDQTPAVIEHRYGKGKVYFVGTLAGCSYGWTVKRDVGKIEVGYRDVNRRLITDFIARTGVKLPLTCSASMVEADLLESPAGIGVVLTNYAGEEPLKTISLSITVPKKITSVRSVERGALPFTYDSVRKVVKVSLPLSLVDFLVLK